MLVLSLPILPISVLGRCQAVVVAQATAGAATGAGIAIAIEGSALVTALGVISVLALTVIGATVGAIHGYFSSKDCTATRGGRGGEEDRKQKGNVSRNLVIPSLVLTLGGTILAIIPLLLPAAALNVCSGNVVLGVRSPLLSMGCFSVLTLIGSVLWALGLALQITGAIIGTVEAITTKLAA